MSAQDTEDFLAFVNKFCFGAITWYSGLLKEDAWPSIPEPPEQGGLYLIYQRKIDGNVAYRVGFEITGNREIHRIDPDSRQRTYGISEIEMALEILGVELHLFRIPR